MLRRPVDRADGGDRAPVDPAEPDEWLDELPGPPRLLRILRSTRPRPARVPVLAHADLGAEHVLERNGQLTGIVDRSDAAVTDPALDLARLYRDFGPRFLDDALRVYGHDAAGFRRRMTFSARCAPLEDLAYGWESGREEYRRSAERSLSWLFPDSEESTA